MISRETVNQRNVEKRYDEEKVLEPKKGEMFKK